MKLIRPEFANRKAFVRRFEREAQTVAQLEHPHIVPLIHSWRDPGGAYLVMPYLRGGSLEDALQAGGWSLAPAVRLLEQVGDALAHAHRRGVIHRNIKPSNVLLDEDGNAYLSDFVIGARLTDAVDLPLDTSLAHLSPEAIRGEVVTFSSDLFSLGVLVFSLLTGGKPPGKGPLPSLGDSHSGIAVELDLVLTRATGDDSSSRFDKAEDFMRAFRQAAGADVVAMPQSAASHPASEPTRNPYKGLRAFREADASDFFGRDSLVEELVHAVSSRHIVAVVGPSGSGKSSVVRAGLIPVLRGGALPGSRQWLATEMFPGSHPFEELEQRCSG